jgi:hypothetical protein
VKALKAQNEELKEQVSLRMENYKSLNDLKATQQQLFNLKMASLGELTAGRPMKFKPIKFVNNFSS